MFDLFEQKLTGNILHDRPLTFDFTSIIDTRRGEWQSRIKDWKTLGIKSEIGRDNNLLKFSDSAMRINPYTDAKRMQSEAGRATDLTFSGAVRNLDYYREKNGKKKGRQPIKGTSTFDPCLCEIMYRAFVPDAGRILDPFAGGSVRGIVAHFLNYHYAGIELRPEQVESNIEQAKAILQWTNQPLWLTGDSDKVLDNLTGEYDFIFSCPPYADLEVYSDLPDDLSNMPYADFLCKYQSIIYKAAKLLKHDRHAVFVVGDIRDEKGYYRDFIADTIKAFVKAGLQFEGEAILLNQVASASMRASVVFTAGRKLTKIHQNVLFFYKP